MSIAGDLATLQLPDLLQNLEMHGRSGTLTLETPEGDAYLYFNQGKLALLSSTGHPDLMTILVASGTITASQLERARKKRRGSRKSLGEVLVTMKAFDEETLTSIARARLLDTTCELVSSVTGSFSFTEGGVPRGMFDAEERKLDLAFDARSLLLEAARREDHWRMIREWIPSDSAHYIPQKGRSLNIDPAYADLAQALFEELDGTRSVAEAMARFPHQRFEAYQVLAKLAESRTIQVVEASRMARIADEIEDAKSAYGVVKRGLEAHPRHSGLLLQKARLAEQYGETEEAVEALKLLVQLELEGGRREEAIEFLDAAKRLGPLDTAIWERSMALAIEDGRHADAVEDGTALAELYREPGLHRKACEVFETLLSTDPTSWDLTRELAHSRAACGDVVKAIQGLDRFGRRRLAMEEYDIARVVFEEILELDPKRTETLKTIEEIDSHVFATRRLRRKRIARIGIALFLALAAGYWISMELAARSAYSDALRRISDRGMIEFRQYGGAIELLEGVQTDHPFTATSAFDVSARLMELQDKLLHIPGPLSNTEDVTAPQVLDAPDAEEMTRAGD